MKSLFVCQQCGNEYGKWFGRCPACGEWNSLVETPFIKNSKSKKSNSKQIQNSNIKPVKLFSVSTQKISRIRTNISELDRSLGGGLVPGQVVLLAGIPGIGKSTLLLQLADKLDNVLYVSGEESVNQVGIRAQRLGIKNKNIEFLETTDVDQVTQLIGNSVNQLIIVDSIQTMATSDLTGLSGSVGQVKECAFRLLHICKSKNIPLILVGHVTKEGSVAGPSILAHMVDTVLWFEGDKSLTLRLLRAVKNRFGPTDEVGIFTMEDKGLQPILEPEKSFISQIEDKSSGSVKTVLLEGTRPILVEIQSLVIPTKLPIPRRVAQGISSARLEMLLAILSKKMNLKFYEMDVFVNVVGGIKAVDPSVDLAVCLSLVSSTLNKPLSKKVVAVGEVGLLGEIRKSPLIDKRQKEVKRLGYNNFVCEENHKTLQEVIKSYFK